MTSEEVENLILQGEGLNVEFKRAGGGAHDDTFESVCSFLNRYGGEMLLGVTNEGVVIRLPAAAIPDMIKNHIIAGFFQQIGRADELGSGVRNLFKYVREYAQGEPRFDEEDVFTLTVPINQNAHSTPTVNAHSMPTVATEGTLSTPPVKLEHVSPRQLCILKTLEHGDKGNAELLGALGIKQKDDLNKRYLKPLILGGAIVMRDPDHPNNPRQTYGITEFGKKLLNGK